MTKAKPYAISKQVVWDAYKKVKANRGAAGVDGESLAAFEKDLKNNLYKIWNRMSSGSYFPPPVLRVEIPKGNTGATRPFGIPTVSDRIAQMVVKMYSRTAGGASLPSRLLRVSSRQVGVGCGRRHAPTMLAAGLGDRSGYQRLL